MADKMIDLKITEKDREKTEMPVMDSSGNVPRYPYWAELRLEGDLVKKLKLTNAKGDDTMKLEADIKVKEIRFKDSGKGNEVESLTIQIQKMGICSKDDAEKKMRKEVEKEVYE